MNKKYQVFISSTYIDLKNERQAVVEAILKAGHIPAGMELFKSGKSQWNTITKWIDESDIYILILGGRYGSIDLETGKSYTQLEYEYALSKNMPVFAIIISDEWTSSKVKEADNYEDIIETNNKSKYSNFKDEVYTKIIAPASSIAEVKLAVHENIHQFEGEYNLKGWIRGDSAEELDKFKDKNLNLSEKVTKLESQLEKLKSKERNKATYKSGYTYEKLTDLLDNKKITIPEGYFGATKPVDTTLLPVSLS